MASPPDTERKTITLSRMTVRYLEAPKKKGTHGSDVAGVMTRLIEQGVQQAIEKGYIRLIEDDE
jgi:hypothetical protein